jgi:hypothetical protein
VPTTGVFGKLARLGGELSEEFRCVAGHLAAYPDAEFTPHAIGRVLGWASGAVANALDQLTALGQA